MRPEKLDFVDEDADVRRRSVHDAAAAIISVRALAEVLTQHLPMLVAMSRSTHSPTNALIPQKTLDALPAIPNEIVELCEIAREALRRMDAGAKANDQFYAPAARGVSTSRADLPNDRLEPEGARVLLVEDEETVRYVVSQTLKAQGCKATSTSGGEEALRLLDEQEFDLVLVDLRMPGMSGCETAKRIRQRESLQGKRSRIVGLTASPLLEDQQHAMAAGMDAVLVKPMDETALRAVLGGIRP